MKNFEVFYDEKQDVLYIAREGNESEVVELSPGVNMELDEDGHIIGVEVFKAAELFKNVLKPMGKKLHINS